MLKFFSKVKYKMPPKLIPSKSSTSGNISMTITDTPTPPPSNLTKAVNRVSNANNKKLIESNLMSSLKVKSSKNIVAYDPMTKQVLSGNMSEISKLIKSNPNTIKSRFKKGKSQYKDIKGFQIIRFSSPDDMVNFKNNLTDNNKNVKVIKEKILPKEPPKKKYVIKDLGSQESMVYPLGKHHFKIDMEIEGMTYNDIEQAIGDFTSEAIKKRKLKPTDLVRIIIEDENLKNSHVSHNFVELRKWNPLMIMNKINEVVESNEEYWISSTTHFVVESVNMKHNISGGSYYKKISGGGGNKKEYHLKADVFNKKSLLRIKNTDELCCARAIITQIARTTHGVDSNEYNSIKRGRKLQEVKAKELHELAGVPEGKCGIPEIIQFDEYLEDWQITVIDSNNDILYPNVRSKEYKHKSDENCIYLFYNSNHYDLIINTKLAGFFSKDNFCHKCKKCFKVKDKHKCIFKCNMCCQSDCPVLQMKGEKKFNLLCAECDRYFCNQVCFDNHANILNKHNQSMCDRIWKCQDCKKVLCRETYPPHEHKCGDFLCKNCNQIVDKNHKCYMMPKKLKNPNEDIIFFDFESDISGEHHEVMFSISMYFKDATPIEHHDIEEWCLWAFREEHKGHTIIAHNGKGYDYQFVLKWLYDNTDYEIDTIYGGQKIMSIKIKGLRIRFIDSLCFIPLPLKLFPKTFGHTELKKGFFPHWFNIKENREYIGPMPDKKFFRCNGFKSGERKEFLKWYDNKIKENYVWNQAKEMRDYCISDVDILRKCLITFRALYLKIADIDPLQYLTIAGVCMAIYKYHHIDKTFPERFNELEENIIDSVDVEEVAELKEAFKKETIQNVFEEKKIGIFDYLETHWWRQGFFGGRTNGIKLLHHFKDEEIGMYSDITSLYPTVQFYDPYPKGHYKTINYSEINNTHYDKVRNKEYLMAGFDIELMPPDNLYHPVLPAKTESENGDIKLTFDLKKKRNVWMSNEVYKALDMGYTIIKIHEIRYFEETTTDLFKSYIKTFLKIKQEASGFPDWVFKDKDKLPPEIIEERKQIYINDYLEKQGIQLDINTIEQNRIDNLKDKPEGYEKSLSMKDYCKLYTNPGLRFISKLCLNSLWGKFGQRLNMGKSVIVSNQAEFYKVFTNPQYENFNVLELGKEGDETRKCLINYSVKDKYVENDYNTNVAVACFTTSSARLRLYEALEVLQRQVLYFDTDSVVYVYDKNNPEHIKLENGDLLGEWTDECEGNVIIGIFVTTGPKAYSYMTNDGEAHTKIKGFNLNYSASRKINHDNIVQLVKDKYIHNQDNKISVKYDMLKRNKDKTISNFSQDKSYGITYSKREILPPDEEENIDTIPFGYNMNNY